MIFVDRYAISHPEIFFSREIEIANKRLGEFYSRPLESRSQEKYNRPFEPELRKRIVHALQELFNGKCAYCESSVNTVTHGNYDNFRPKNGTRGLNKEFSRDHYWWLTYEWANLYYCCPKCNQFKSTWFPVVGPRAKIGTSHSEIVNSEQSLLIDPCIDRPEEHLIYNESGEVDFLTAKGKTTIEIIKLNRVDLVESRRRVVLELKSLWEDYRRLEASASSDHSQLNKFTSYFTELYNSNTSRPYLGIQRQMLNTWENNEDINGLKTSHDFSHHDAEMLVHKNLTVEDKEKINNQLNIENVRHIYVEKIEITNFKCFEYLEIDFTHNAGIRVSKTLEINPTIEPWVLFLGENGVGKSSLLKAIVIGLAGREYLDELKISGEDILKHGEESGSIRIHLVGAVQPIEVTFNKQTVTSTLGQPIVNFVAYNSIRLMPKKGKLRPEKTMFYGARAKNLFDYTFTLVDADEWLLKQNKKTFDRAAITLKDLMLLNNNDKIEQDDNEILIKRGKDSYRIHELSDGYQSMYALSIDIMATLASENVTFDLAEGMVLIDEIGTHLHPRWRMEVVERLRRAFPKIRFVVTTHEPLCLRGLMAGEVIVLTKDSENELMALTDLPDPSELRVDQLLTSEFFGLNSTIDPKTEKLFEEYYSILVLDENERSDDQKNRLLELNEFIPKIKHLGDSLREEVIYYVVDELLAKKTRQDGLKIKEEIKTEALKRVESLWNLIAGENR